MASIRMPMKAGRVIARVPAYAWAAPNTALGAMAGLLVVCLGGRCRWVAGAAEFEGGLVGRFWASLPHPLRFGAMTLGHVILGVDRAQLAVLRAHEHAHVRQYEKWGPFFLPAYFLSSVWQVAHGRCGYRHNFFERQACAIADGLESRCSRTVPADRPRPRPNSDLETIALLKSRSSRP